ncbi:MAG: DUF421 domain-containing protein [Oscillospiraceae bacterium]|nr:DUF421 domain-containing protein [Oscillospiraceae bacterium]
MVIACIRTIILYIIIIIGVRLLGKRQVGELEPSELVLALIIADLAAVPMQDFGIPLLFGIIPIVTLLCLSMIISILNTKSIRFRAIMCGRPSILIHEGKLNQREMAKNRFTIDELTEELRMKNIYDISLVKYGILETNGQLSVLLYANRQPVTAEQLGIGIPETGLPLILINDGRIMARNLETRGLSLDWLDKRLKERRIHSAQEVFLFTVDEKEQIYLVRKEAEVRV